MATSPIYNWPEPDNTDLVKNGALAMRTLGDAIDTTMATMIPKSLIAAKGDLVAASANDTPAILSVGNNGETLVADSSTATGLRYQAPVNVNPFLNSNFSVWQRGTSISVSASTVPYTADRWGVYCSPSNALTISRQATGDTTNLPFIQYCMRFQRNAGQTGTGGLNLVQSMETINSVPYAGKTVTMSFYARKGANYSATSSALSIFLMSGTGTDQNRNGAAYTGEAQVINQTATLTTTWQRFSYTGTVPATATELSFYNTFEPQGTAGAADYYEITGVQLEVGSVATPYKPNGATIQGELAACQRYYYLHASGNSKMIGNGSYYSAAEVDTMIQFPVTMRTAPTIDQITGTDYYTIYRNGAADGFNSFTTSYASTTGTNLFNASQVSGTAGQAGQVATNSASAYLGFSAEL